MIRDLRLENLTPLVRLVLSGFLSVAEAGAPFPRNGPCVHVRLTTAVPARPWGLVRFPGDGQSFSLISKNAHMQGCIDVGFPAASMSGLGEPAGGFLVILVGDKIYCVHEAETANAIFRHAREGGFPVDSVTEISAVIGTATGQTS